MQEMQERPFGRRMKPCSMCFRLHRRQVGGPGFNLWGSSKPLSF